MFKKLTCWVVALFLAGSLGAQQAHEPTHEHGRNGHVINKCYTMEVDQKLRDKFPELGTLSDFEKWLAPKVREYKQDLAPGKRAKAILTVPIIFHIVHNGEAVGSGSNISATYVNAQLVQLNNDFRKIMGTSGFNSNPVGADTELQFCAALVDPNGNVLAEPGINRINRNTQGWNAPPYSDTYTNATIKPQSIWDPTRYVNTWVMSLTGGLLGYAQFPNMSGVGGLFSYSGPASTDGVVVLYTSVGSSTVPYPGASPYDLGRTLTHELGHFFGLLHTFQGGCGANNDYCDDTPRVSSPTFGCPTGRTTCSGSVAMIENYMDYSYDACMNIFTLDQKARIQAVMANSPRRMELTSSTACSIPMPCSSCPLISAVSSTTGCDDNNTCFPIDDIYQTSFRLTHQSCASETGDGQFSVVFDPGGDNIVFGPFNYSTGTTTQVQIYIPYGAATGDEIGVYDNDFPCGFTYPNTFNPSPLPGCSNYSTPLVDCPPTWSACPGTSIVPATTGTATAQDCEGNTLTVSYSDLEIGVGLASGESIIQRTWTSAPDIMGNAGTCIQIINRDDTTPPTIICPATQTLVLGANCSAVLPNYTGLATPGDNCGVQGVTQSPAAGTIVSNAGNMTVTLTVADIGGNTAQCSFTVTKVDNTPPTVMCFNQTVTFNGQNTIPLNAGDLVTASDNCGVGTTTLSPNGISCEQLGQIVPVTVTVTDVNNNTATCTSNITVTGLPCGWSQNPDGVNCEDGNSIAYAPPTGIWTATSTNCFYGPPFTSDATAFAQRSLCGDGSITALITNINGNGWAGVVMRESNASGAKKAQLMTNLSNLSRREFRTATNAAAQPQQFPSQNRYWLRITRAGNQFSMYVSPNGMAWYPAGTQTIVMDNCIQMGLVATNYTTNSTVTATFANVSFTGSNISVAATTQGVARASNLDQQHTFEVYPNPTGGELNVDLTQYIGRSVRIETYSLEGKLLQFSELDEVQNTLERLDMKGFHSGMYLVKVKSDGLPDATKRVVLQRG